MAHSDRTARFPLYRLLLASILALAVAIGPSLAAPPASAAANPPVTSAPFPSAIEEEWEEEAGEWEVEDDEEEWEVGEETEVEGEGGWEVSGEGRRREAPESCSLYRTSAHVVASERRDSVSLTIDYTMDRPARVEVKLWLKGSQGAMQMRPLRRRMSRHGTLRGVESLNSHEMTKVRAARAFVVDLDMEGAPSYCERYCERRLTTRQRRGDRTVWSEPAPKAQGY